MKLIPIAYQLQTSFMKTIYVIIFNATMAHNIFTSIRPFDKSIQLKSSFFTDLTEMSNMVYLMLNFNN